MSDVLRVLIADDHPVMRAGVRAALEADSCEVVAEASDAAGAVIAARTHRPDACLLDIHMPGGGITAALEIRRLLPETFIVMLTGSRNDDDLFDALRAGASGYLFKDMNPDRLGSALRGVLAGEAALPRSLVLRVVEQFRASPRHHISPTERSATARLTPREVEVLDLMSGGLSTEEIAKRLFVAQVTVRTHISAILKKLRAPDREAAVRVSRGIPS